MLRSFLFFLFVWFSQNIFATSFNQLFIFGDSLSDIGNMPPAAQLLTQSAAAKLSRNKNKYKLSADDYTASFYVPISNPANQDGKKLIMSDYFSGVKTKFSWPKVSAQDYLNSYAYMPQINDKKRESSSLLWPQFLFFDARAEGLTKSPRIYPRMYINSKNTKSIEKNASIDYAWASALAGTKCANDNFNFQPGSCRLNNIYAAWSNYYKNRTVKNRLQVRIPGLLAQVNLFIDDVKKKRITLNSNSAAIIWIGGNDMSKAFSQLQTSGMSTKWRGMQSLMAGIAKKNGKALKMLSNFSYGNLKHPIKQIYLLTLFNPKWTPRVQGWSSSLHVLAGILTDIYNAGLRWEVWRASHNAPWVHIKIVPVRDWFDNWASGEGRWQKVFPKKNLGVACQQTNAKYNQAQTPKDNCMGYLFWNAVHPSMSVEQLLGFKQAEFMRAAS